MPNISPFKEKNLNIPAVITKREITIQIFLNFIKPICGDFISSSIGKRLMRVESIKVNIALPTNTAVNILAIIPKDKVVANPLTGPVP